MRLSVQRLVKRFGGLTAVADVSFTVQSGHIHSVIGPNGAGKTTLFNLISGVDTPSSGMILLDDRDVTGAPPERLAHLGVSRTFQNLQICMNLTAVDNVMVGAHRHLNSSFLAALVAWPRLRRDDRACRLEAQRLLAFVGLQDYLDAEANQLPYGALKRLEIARALAARPRLLLLDEPAAGLNPTETVAMDGLIRAIAATGVTVLLVEHDMKLVMSLSDHILVLNYGAKLAEGTAADVRANPDVIAAYLGQEIGDV